MGKEIEIEIEGEAIGAVLNDSNTAGILYEALPRTLTLSRWGDEYYGNAGISSLETEGARELMEVGELAYWAPGSALCIFFGPTPASTDDRPRAASEVVPLGRVTGDPAFFSSFGSSITAKIKPAG